MLKNKLVILIACVIMPLAALAASDDGMYDAKGKRNPFIPLVTPDGRLMNIQDEEAASAVNLEGIIFDKKGLSYAIVNGEVVKVGNTVGEYQVLKIEEKKVTFIKEGQPLEIELKKED
ncbi:MAG TPA: hypothetical protein PKL77_08310 [Candidatus Omnitrophota bacterium]|nr:hypothetical protein [Candidatus Omnitrophota bacterium]HPT07956.1 hypothetical protein [Candidatus Omnitrophota bacterium]